MLQLLKNREDYQPKAVRGKTHCGRILCNRVLIYVLKSPDDMMVVTLLTSSFTWSLEGSVSRKSFHVEERMASGDASVTSWPVT